MKKIISILFVVTFLLCINLNVNSKTIPSAIETDFDPLVDIEITFEAQVLRYLEEDAPLKSTKNIFNQKIDQNFDNSPIFQYLKNIINKKTSGTNNFNMYLKVFINGNEFTSNIWNNKKYVYDPDWSVTYNVPDDQEIVNIKIQLWNSKDIGNDVICDISGDSGVSDVELEYNIKSGHWTGDDELNDPSGYGRLCGCDDGTILKTDKDAELWFNIYQNDYDGDGIPYWYEVNEYGSDPEVKNSGDPDNDDIPVDWEWKWGYDPFNFENHDKLDPDGDSIDNLEEYLTSEWFSDPFRKDVFVEMDIMGEGPGGKKAYFPENSKELLFTAFNRQNFVIHIDSGDMGGHDIVPFDELSSHGEITKIYEDYFLHGNPNTWRRGVFHYGLVAYEVDGPNGYTFKPNAFVISSKSMEDRSGDIICPRDITYASCYMHELGHTFAFWPIPGHDENSRFPWQLGFWLNRPYKSCMNYAWVYNLVDFSDGSRRDPDIDDWARIDWDSFERNW